MDRWIWIVIITAIAGIGGTGLGGIVGAVFKKESTKVVSLLLAFAGGIMMAIVCFELVPEAFHPEGTLSNIPFIFVVLGIVFGFVAVYFLNRLIDKKVNPEIEHIDKNHPATADSLEELIHADHLHKHTQEGNKSEMRVAGIVMACAIGLHNIPEGMVIGATYAGSTQLIVGGAGFLIAVVIGLHNIPEGMSVSVPLIAGGMKKYKAVLITALSGAFTVIGAILGLLVGLISPVWLSLSLSFASGAMMYVVLCELLPESFLMWKSKAPGTMALLGMLIGLILVQI